VAFGAQVVILPRLRFPLMIRMPCTIVCHGRGNQKPVAAGPRFAAPTVAVAILNRQPWAQPAIRDNPY
jgi:hypothetical protein